MARLLSLRRSRRPDEEFREVFRAQPTHGQALPASPSPPGFTHVGTSRPFRFPTPALQESQAAVHLVPHGTLDLYPGDLRCEPFSASPVSEVVADGAEVERRYFLTELRGFVCQVGGNRRSSLRPDDGIPVAVEHGADVHTSGVVSGTP